MAIFTRLHLPDICILLVFQSADMSPSEMPLFELSWPKIFTETSFTLGSQTLPSYVQLHFFRCLGYCVGQRMVSRPWLPSLTPRCYFSTEVRSRAVVFIFIRVFFFSSHSIRYPLVLVFAVYQTLRASIWKAWLWSSRGIAGKQPVRSKNSTVC